MSVATGVARAFQTIALMALALPQTGHAIISMEDLHLSTPTDGFSGRAELSTSGSGGNSDRSDVSAGTRLQWHRGADTDFLLLSYAYGKSRDVTNTNRSLAHLRHIHQRSARFALEGFGQMERNEFARLSLRSLIGGGMRYRLTGETGKTALIDGTGVFYEHEEISESATSTDAGSDSTWRSNLYLVAKYQPAENIRMVSTTYYQPRLRSLNDYRLLQSASLQLDITNRLALMLNLDFARDSKPPQAVEKSDYSYRLGSGYQF